MGLPPITTPPASPLPLRGEPPHTAPTPAAAAAAGAAPHAPPAPLPLPRPLRRGRACALKPRPLPPRAACPSPTPAPPPHYPPEPHAPLPCSHQHAASPELRLWRSAFHAPAPACQAAAVRRPFAPPPPRRAHPRLHSLRSQPPRLRLMHPHPPPALMCPGWPTAEPPPCLGRQQSRCWFQGRGPAPGAQLRRCLQAWSSRPHLPG